MILSLHIMPIEKQCHMCQISLGKDRALDVHAVKKPDFYLCSQCNDVYDFMELPPAQPQVQPPAQPQVQPPAPLARSTGIICVKCKKTFTGKTCVCGASNPLYRQRK
jgi:hypothetical protein